MIKPSFYVILLAVVFFSCKSGKDNAKVAEMAEYKSLAEKVLSAPITYIFNEDSTYMMCQNVQKETASVKGKETTTGIITDFLIVKIADNEIAYQKKLEGDVTWHSKLQLKIAPTKGILDNNSAYLYNVATGLRVPFGIPNK